ncbi:transposase [Thermobifida halotolerans]|uniref:Transposase n=1 Tax=Thermobifida halotolerans TaxID=483545 RepID=A0AA97M0Q1_9ACTN|nr:integrase core domain-containing protein [Thermobifida halotolerans]UOE21343.1 transposase [Thermobifida halotolerans]
MSTSLRTDPALDALETGLGSREHVGRSVDGLIHHSDRGVRYLAVRSTRRLAEARAVASVGTTGNSYDNALAEAFHSLFKAELVRNRRPWKNIDDLELAVAEYVDWFDHRRLHGETGLVPPAESEADFYQHNPEPTSVDALVPSLQKTWCGPTVGVRGTCMWSPARMRNCCEPPRRRWEQCSPRAARIRRTRPSGAGPSTPRSTTKSPLVPR